MLSYESLHPDAPGSKRNKKINALYPKTLRLETINSKLVLILYYLLFHGAESYLIVKKLHRVHLKLVLFGPHPLINRQTQ